MAEKPKKLSRKERNSQASEALRVAASQQFLSGAGDMSKAQAEMHLGCITRRAKKTRFW